MAKGPEEKTFSAMIEENPHLHYPIADSNFHFDSETFPSRPAVAAAEKVRNPQVQILIDQLQSVLREDPRDLQLYEIREGELAMGGNVTLEVRPLGMNQKESGSLVAGDELRTFVEQTVIPKIMELMPARQRPSLIKIGTGPGILIQIPETDLPTSHQ